MTFTLRSDNGTSAVVTTAGGELVSFTKDGREYVWQGDPAHWDGHAPILFPVVCTPLDNKIAFDGVEYPMPAHGFAWTSVFTPVYVTKSSVTLELCESEATLSMFPFRFTLSVTYTVTDDGFDVEFAVKNRDEKEMTFCIGGHPGFNCPMEEGEDFRDYRLVFDNAEGAVVSGVERYVDDTAPRKDRLIGTNELPLLYSDYDEETLIVENLPVRRVKLVSNRTGHGISFDFEGFDVLGLWSPAKKSSPFLCLEPWNGLPGNVSETTDAKRKKYAITLSCGETYRVGYRTRAI